MKKFVTLLLTAALAVTAATTAFADDTATQIGPSTTPPSKAIEIGRASCRERVKISGAPAP